MKQKSSYFLIEIQPRQDLHMEAFIQFVPLIVIVALIYFFSKSNNKKRWFKVGGYLLLLIVSLRVAGVPEYINDYRAEKALAEQMEQGGFVDQGVYYKAQSLNIPTKALYDKHLKEQREKEQAEAARLKEKREAEAARLIKSLKEGYQYISGRIDVAVFCGTQREGFEIFIAENNDGVQVKLNKISPIRYGEPATFKMEPESFRALVVPFKNGRPIYDAISKHTFVKEIDHYALFASFYLNEYDYKYYPNTKSPPSYKVYRDGSRLEYYVKDMLYLPASLASSNPVNGCTPITTTSQNEVFGERLRGLAKWVEVKWQTVAAKQKAQKNATKF